MLYVIPDILLKVAFNTNKTGHHVIHYNWHIVESGLKQIKWVNMLYVITDKLLKLVLNTNKTGHYVIGYTWHIVESGTKHQ